MLMGHWLVQAQAFYEYEDVPDSDEEMSIGHGSASDMSAASSQAGSLASHASTGSDLDLDGQAEVLSRAPNTALGSPATAAGLDFVEPAAAGGAASHVGKAVSTENMAMLHLQTDPSTSTACCSPERAPTRNHTGHSTQKVGASDFPADHDAATEPRGLDRQIRSPANNHLHPDNDSVLVHKANGLSADVPSAATSGLPTTRPKRKALTVFDQDKADEAEAADLHAGIAASTASNPEAVAVGVQRQAGPGVASNGDGVSAETLELVANRVDEAHNAGLQGSHKRRMQPRLAPWR